jgi:lauroyl/myristoyl acyltransferase
MLKRLLLTVCALLMAFVYLPALGLLGPRWAVLLSRVLARLHWLLTLAGVNVGQEKKAYRAMRALLPTLRPDLRPAGVLRRYLANKHQSSVEHHLCRTARGRRFLQQTYPIEGREHLDAALREGRGAIIQIFHFGLCQPLWPVLRLTGYDILLHMDRSVHYLGDTFGWAVRAAVKVAAVSDAFCGTVLYHTPIFMFSMMARQLRRGGLVGMNGSGTDETTFVEVPFLGASIRLPVGPARLAAHAGAPVVPVYALADGRGRQPIVIHPALRPAGQTPEALRDLVAAYTTLLDGYVRRYPWLWWSWRRLSVGWDGDGHLRLALRLSAEADEAPATGTPVPTRPARKPRALAPEARRHAHA